MQDLAADFIINNTPPIEFEAEISEPEHFDCVFEIDAKPTKVSQLENDLNYQTDEQVEASIQAESDTINARIDDEVETLNTEINKKVETITGSPLIDVQRTDNAVTITSQTYIHEQGIASDTWVIEHNLNKYPSVSIVDTANTVFIGQIIYNNTNKCTILINGATKGNAYLN